MPGICPAFLPPQIEGVAKPLQRGNELTPVIPDFILVIPGSRHSREGGNPH
ncbi:hypothetical protein [Endozoicomonas sp. 8E]|uniref:hypothetical protein n=1 Tax=Endozoicomonas sp. 8E TaxID=3035692 RepID=UPI002938D8FF|nr:hypothetical protein [Endozoicomonas sp. 8E]WOG27675.1 hypothetical protein P6910_24530 [Endozoicomonas sp. 8E]